MKKALLLVSLVVPAMLIVNFASVISDKLSNPIIYWSPTLIEEKISPGDASELNVVFESKEDLQNIELWLTPELKDFITFTPEGLDSVPANAKNSVYLKISVPAETPLGAYYGTLHIRVGKRTIPQTLKITLEISEPLSEENLITMLETHKEAAQNFNAWLEVYGREKARQMTVEWLKEQNNVQETGISEDGTIWILFTNGIEGDIETYPPGTLGKSEGNSLIFLGSLQKMVNKINAAVFSGPTTQPFIASNQPIVVGNDRVIVLDPFLDELDEGSPQSYVYSKISPLTKATYLKNEEVTIDVIKNVYGYGVVSITTHGRLHRDVVGFLSGEKITPINILFHIGDLRNKRLSIGWHGLTPYYEILPSFITNYAKESYPKSLIYIGACQSLKNTTMADAFLSRRAATYFGFTRTTSALFNREKAEELFTSLIDKRQTTEEAFTNGLDPYWPGSDPEYGYESEPAKFEMAGEFNLTLLLAPLPEWSLPEIIYSSSWWPRDPAIISDNLGHLHVTWTEYLPDTYNSEIFYSRRDEKTWSKPIDISNTPTYSARNNITIDSLNYPHVVWVDGRDVFYTAWDGEKWLDPSNLTKMPSYYYAEEPRIVSDNLDRLHLVWKEEFYYGGSSVRYNMWDGEKWLSFGKIYCRACGQYYDVSNINLISDSANYLHVVWRNYNYISKIYDIFYTRWDGINWSEPINISNTPQESDHPNIIINSFDYPHVVWSEFVGDNFEIFYTHWDGSKWISPLSISNSFEDSKYPYLTIDESRNIHVVWTDIRSSYPFVSEVLYTRYDGMTWSKPEIIPNMISGSFPYGIITDIFNYVHVIYVYSLEGVSYISHVWR